MVESAINAVVESTRLGIEDHGIFTCYLHLRGDGWGQAFGGYALDEYSQTSKRRIGTMYGCEFIAKILTTLNVPSWEDLPGTPLRCRRDATGKLAAVGHFVEDRWFDPQDIAALAHKFNG